MLKVGWLCACMCVVLCLCVCTMSCMSLLCAKVSLHSVCWFSIYSVLQKMQNSRMQQWNQLSTTLQMSFGHVQLHGHLWNPSYIHAPLRSGKVCIDFTYFNPIDYMSITTAFRSTIYTQYSVLKEMQLSLGNLSFPTTITYNHFRMAWYCYMKQLDVDYSNGFCCPKCGNKPQAVVMDATSLAFRKELDSWKLVLQAPKSKERSGR